MTSPSPWATKIGSAPTERQARTGELTPPGMTFWARANSELLLAYVRVDIQPSPSILERVAAAAARGRTSGATASGSLLLLAVAVLRLVALSLGLLVALGVG